jgi:hypothetical protein
MPRAFFSPDPPGTPREPPPLCRDDLEAMIQDLVGFLADIEAVYDGRRRKIAEQPLTETRKATLLKELNASYRRDRQPHAQLLAELHRGIMRLTLFRTNH